MKKADQLLPAVLCGSLALGLWAAPLRAQTENPLASVGAAALATPEELSEQEVIRRKEQLIRGQKALDEAAAAMKAGKFDEAAEAYTKALRTFPKGPVAAKEIAAAKAGVINAYINKGKASIRSKNYEDARKAADQILILDPANAAAKSIIKTAEHAPQKTEEAPKGPKGAPAAVTADVDTVPRTIPPVDETPEFRKAQNQTTQLLRDARLAFQSNQLDLAIEKINSALVLDRYNEEARVLLRQVNEQRYHTAHVDMGRVRTQYAADTLEAWAPPVKPPRTTPRPAAAPTTPISREKELLERKLDTIRLPKIDFKEANIVDVIQFLAETSRAIDKAQGGNGVNVVFAGGLAGGGGSAPAPEAAAPAPAAAPVPGPAAPPVPGAAVPGAPGAPAPAAEPLPAPAAPLPAAPAALTTAPAAAGTPAITLNLQDVPLRDALRYVTDIAGLKFIVDKYAVLIVPPSYQPPGIMQMREFQVPPGIFTTVMTGGAAGAAPAGGAPGGAPAPAAPMPAAAPAAGGGTGVTNEDIKKFFTDAGVKFDTGASVTYQQATSRLFVANTPDNLDTIESILNTLRRAGGTQVTIEAKFIEIQQTDLRELGFDWIMGDWGFGSVGGVGAPGNPAFSVGGGTANAPGGFPTFPSDQTSTATATEKLTQGNRFASTQGTLTGNKLDSLLNGQTANATTVNDAVARMTGLLTNPQFQVILRALSQRRNVDLLCAPKVTTISGQQAKIEVVREFIYPTEFEPPRVASASSSAATTATTVSAPMISPPTPGGFQMRQLGVTLNVTPQIGETGLINLTLIPEVSDFDGFVDYGSRDSLGSSAANNNSASAGFTLVFPFPQPVFSTRRVTTSVMVYDGSTVVLGGLIREDSTKVTDKVPFLGDLPLLGKLFRNELENTIKKNLMVFVTARLIDPYGDPMPRMGATSVDVAPAVPAAAVPPAAAPAP
ncbi:MAG: hypothetical protein NTY01_13775 [Verrucomicrobia bacterium]|nr:hypothetical protein [Verrucomicrobiota bacterium]